MTIAKTLLKNVVGLQSVAVLGRATKLIPKKNNKIKPQKQSKKLIKGFVDITASTALIKPTTKIVNQL